MAIMGSSPSATKGKSSADIAHDTRPRGRDRTPRLTIPLSSPKPQGILRNASSQKAWLIVRLVPSAPASASSCIAEAKVAKSRRVWQLSVQENAALGAVYIGGGAHSSLQTSGKLNEATSEGDLDCSSAMSTPFVESSTKSCRCIWKMYFLWQVVPFMEFWLPSAASGAANSWTAPWPPY